MVASKNTNIETEAKETRDRKEPKISYIQRRQDLITKVAGERAKS